MEEKIQVPAIQIDVSQVAFHIKNPIGLINQVADLVGAKVESIGDEKNPAFAVTISEPVVSHDYCRSVAAKISACKKPVIEESKRLAAEAKEIVNADIAFRKSIEAAFNALADKARLPLTEWENSEKERKAAHTAKISELQNLGVFDGFEPTSAQINERMNAVNDFDVSVLEEFVDEASKVKTELTATLSTRYIAVKQDEEQSAELERLRIAEQQRLEAERIETEAKQARLTRLNNLLAIPAKCQNLTIFGMQKELELIEGMNVLVDDWVEQYAPAVNGKAQVISQLQQMIVDAEQAEAERVEKLQKEAADKAKAEAEAKAAAEAQRIENERKAKEAAELKAKQDAERAEAQRKAEEQAEAERQARKEAERKADVEHRRKINNEALQSILCVIGNSPDNSEIAKQIVSAIANGEVNHVSINY